ncbi:MAG: HTH domain-containing protein [Acidobacteriota bacterium]|nr:HTH domain-containing protein [Acidobacteriota bacterium]
MNSLRTPHSKPDPSAGERAIVFDAIRSASGPVTRPQLCERTGLHDRVVRECISRLVKTGEQIVSVRRGGGYQYGGGDEAKVEREYRRLMSQGTQIIARAQALKRGPVRQAALFPEAVSA